MDPSPARPCAEARHDLARPTARDAQRCTPSALRRHSRSAHEATARPRSLLSVASSRQHATARPVAAPRQCAAEAMRWSAASRRAFAASSQTRIVDAIEVSARTADEGGDLGGLRAGSRHTRHAVPEAEPAPRGARTRGEARARPPRLDGR